MSTNYNPEVAAIYAKRDNQDTGYLAYRDLPALLSQYGKHLQVLDFGCGTGFSSALLAEIGHKVVGVDISANMLAEAEKSHPTIRFIEMAANKLPFEERAFDIVLCAFVLLELDSLKTMADVLIEIRRVTKTKGRLVIITTSEHFPKHNWLTASNPLGRTINLNCGDNYCVTDTRSGMVFSDFYYSDASYRRVLTESGFIVEKLIQPLGQPSDNIPWTIEWDLPPYSIYVCSPIE